MPAAGIALTGPSFVVGLARAHAALIAVIAAVRGHAAVVMLVFVASFFPVGVVLVTAEHWLRWIGVLDVGLLVAAVGMWLSARLGERAVRSA
jgi:adenosine/AMP kinase